VGRGISRWSAYGVRFRTAISSITLIASSVMLRRSQDRPRLLKMTCKAGLSRRLS